MAVPFPALKTMVTVFVLVLGNVSPVDPIAAELVTAIAGIAISAGTSMASTAQAVSQSGYGVTCQIQVENWTRYPLIYPSVRSKDGVLVTAPTAILPGKKEAFATRKSKHAATGTYGTASWELQGADRRLVIMWSTPYDQTYYSNWMGVGMTRQGLTSVPDGNTWYDQMYYRTSDSDLAFERQEYYKYTDHVIFRNDEFEIVGIMTNIHNAEIKVIFRPTENNPEDLAGTIKSLLAHQKRKRQQQLKE